MANFNQILAELSEIARDADEDARAPRGQRVAPPLGGQPSSPAYPQAEPTPSRRFAERDPRYASPEPRRDYGSVEELFGLYNNVPGDMNPDPNVNRYPQDHPRYNPPPPRYEHQQPPQHLPEGYAQHPAMNRQAYAPQRQQPPQYPQQPPQGYNPHGGYPQQQSYPHQGQPAPQYPHPHQQHHQQRGGQHDPRLARGGVMQEQQIMQLAAQQGETFTAQGRLDPRQRIVDDRGVNFQDGGVRIALERIRRINPEEFGLSSGSAKQGRAVVPETFDTRGNQIPAVQQFIQGQRKANEADPNKMPKTREPRVDQSFAPHNPHIS